jgi:hypothetical protein
LARIDQPQQRQLRAGEGARAVDHGCEDPIERRALGDATLELGELLEQLLALLERSQQPRLLGRLALALLAQRPFVAQDAQQLQRERQHPAHAA